MILLDSSAIIDFVRGGEKVKAIVAKEEARGTRITTTTVSSFEILARIYYRRLKREHKLFKAFFRQIEVLGLDYEASEEAAKVMASLMKIGRPINPLDVLICGTALANGVETIITGDSDFKQVEKVADIQVSLV